MRTSSAFPGPTTAIKVLGRKEKFYDTDCSKWTNAGRGLSDGGGCPAGHRDLRLTSSRQEGGGPGNCAGKHWSTAVTLTGGAGRRRPAAWRAPMTANRSYIAENDRERRRLESLVGA